MEYENALRQFYTINNTFARLTLVIKFLNRHKKHGKFIDMDVQ